MRKVALRGLFSRKLRLVLTSLAVALGVMLIAGTYVFTDTINASFDRIFQATNKGTDASITPRQDVTNDQGTAPTVPASVLAKVRLNPRVAEAEGSLFDIASVFGADGKSLGATGSPSFVASTSAVARFRASTPQGGRLPATADEAALDASTAKRKGVKVGDTIIVQGDAPKKTYKVVGLTQVAGVDSFGGTTVVNLTLPEAQRVLGDVGRFDEIQVAAKAGTT